MTNFDKFTTGTRNFIYKNNYLITEELQHSLESGEIQKLDSSKENGISKLNLVMIRVLNKNSKVLVYNYMTYPDIFLTTFLHFV
jgi:hypothetical protein